MTALLYKSLLGLLFLLLILILALFLPAGTFDFRQAWVYLAVYFTCSILITAYLFKYNPKLLASRLKIGAIAEPERSQKIIQALVWPFFLAQFILPGLDHRFHWSAVPPLVSLISDIFIALGFYIVCLAFRENTYTSALIEVVPGQKVIDTGPYSVVRHPMYAGALFLFIFTPPALGSWAALPSALPMILTIAARLREEEKFLSANLPGYEAYRRKVRYRLLPFMW